MEDQEQMEADKSKKFVDPDFRKRVRFVKIGNEILIEDGLIKLKVTGKKRGLVLSRGYERRHHEAKKGREYPGNFGQARSVH